MDGESPLGKLRELRFGLLDEFATFPAVLLDEVVVIWTSMGGHKVLPYYSLCNNLYTPLEGILGYKTPTFSDDGQNA